MITADLCYGHLFWTEDRAHSLYLQGTCSATELWATLQPDTPDFCHVHFWGRILSCTHFDLCWLFLLTICLMMLNFLHACERECGLCVWCMHMCVSVCMQRLEEDDGHSPLWLSTLLLWSNLSLILELMFFSEAGDQQALTILLSPSQQHQAYRCADHAHSIVSQILRVGQQVL